MKRRLPRNTFGEPATSARARAFPHCTPLSQKLRIPDFAATSICCILSARRSVRCSHPAQNGSMQTGQHETWNASRAEPERCLPHTTAVARAIVDAHSEPCYYSRLCLAAKVSASPPLSASHPPRRMSCRMCRSAHIMTSISLSTEHEFACPHLALRTRVISVILECVILALFPRHL